MTVYNRTELLKPNKKINLNPICGIESNLRNVLINEEITETTGFFNIFRLKGINPEAFC